MNKYIVLYPLFGVLILSAMLYVYFMTNVQQSTPRFKSAATHGKLITQTETTNSIYHGKRKTRVGLKNGYQSLKRDDVSQIQTGDRKNRKQLALRSNSERVLNKLMKPSIQTKGTYQLDDPEENGNHLLKKDEISQIETGTEKKRTHFLGLTGAWGRLGNHMFFYASLRGIGDAINYTPILSRTDPILKLFEINLNNSVDKFTLNNNVVKGEKCIGIFTKDLMSPINKTTNITVFGYLQSFKYFQKIESDIRKEFILKADIKARVKHIFNTLNISHRIKVGVHVRRGDFVNRKGTKVATPSYFYKAMNILRQNVTNPIFVVCSEDKKWVKDYLQFNDSVIVHESVEVDFGVLMSCDHNIISSGTFGWWTAYLTKATKPNICLK
ncbi:galactoside alpha-(1,2)-fucosyltransferase 1-like [Patella vulgata]|uniref:galactoside alpha-(1,2)-fucosyltransferase 1-like n=1 Tax=Patella vulgata TaxID=6465 RepID=UPI00217F7449|nr:galactoside alpha-(1,2)-fucosyltransferase 1-like [Patella vulgata]